MRQEIIVETKGQLMAAILCFSREVPTTIILIRKTGTTIIEHDWEGVTPLETVIKTIRRNIKRMPEKELLA